MLGCIQSLQEGEEHEEHRGKSFCESTTETEEVGGAQTVCSAFDGPINTMMNGDA